MSWIQTYSGLKVNPLTMTAKDVSIKDIAHALALKCRYTGHCPTFYSVAQHSVLVAQHCPTSKLWALLHDAPEAYFADIARPVKIGLREKFGDAFDAIEDRIMGVICERFGLDEEEPEEVKTADTLLLATEAKCFFGHTKLYREWHHRERNGFPLIEPPVITPWTWRASERAFLAAFSRLADAMEPTEGKAVSGG